MQTRPAAFRPAAIALALWCLLSAVAHSDVDAVQLTEGTGSRQTRKQAVATIPYGQLTAESRNKIAAVVDNASLFRRLPVTAIDVDPDMQLFLVRYPEVLVNIWQIMGVTQMSVQRTGPFTLKSDDGVGAVSDVELIYGTSTKNIYFAEGIYSGPLLKRKLTGKCVMILDTIYEQGPDGTPKTTNSLDVFVKVDNATASLIAKTLNPIVGPTADHNFVESLKFVQRLNETTEENGTGVQRMANRLTSIDDEVREKFIEIAGQVYERNSIRATQRNAYQLGNASHPPVNTTATPNSQPSNLYRSGYQPMPANFSK